MTPENYDCLQIMLDNKDRIKAWRKNTLEKLLRVIIPLIASKPNIDKNYASTAAKLILICVQPFQPTANHIDVYWTQYQCHMTDEIIFDILEEDLGLKKIEENKT
jgi:hypothetical protein